MVVWLSVKPFVDRRPLLTKFFRKRLTNIYASTDHGQLTTSQPLQVG